MENLAGNLDPQINGVNQQEYQKQNESTVGCLDDGSSAREGDGYKRTGTNGAGGPVVSTQPPRSILRSAGSKSRGSASSRRTRLSAHSPDEAASRLSATERARSFIYTPPTKPVNVHQFYATLVNDYQVQPGLLFYDEDTEEEDEEQEGEEGEGQTDTAVLAQNAGQTEERPESVLTDVTIDDQDLSDMSGIQMVPAIKQKASVMSLSTVDERLVMSEGSGVGNENTNNNGDEEIEGATLSARPLTQGTVGYDDFTTSDAIFSTAVDEWTLDAARVRLAQDVVTDTRTQLTKMMMDKLKTLYQEGLKCKVEGQYPSAIRTFSRIIAMRPESVLPYVQRAECYLMTADFHSAIQNYKKACSMEPHTEIYYSRLAFIFYLQGQTYFDCEQYTNALECFSLTAEIRSGNDSYHTRSIACLAVLHRHSECLAIINKRLDEETHNTDLYVMRSRLHLMFKNVALCYYDLKDALALNPDHAEANQLLSQFRQEADSCHTAAVQLALQNRHRDALQKISSAIEYDPTHANYHNIRGALHRQLLDFNSAVDDYLLAMDKTNQDESSPVYQDAQHQLLLTYNDFAIECYKKRFYQEAIMLLNKALKGEQREKGLYVNRGDCFFQSADYQFALADYHQGLELDPADDSIRVRISVIHNEYGTQEYQNKNYSEAESRFSLAIRNNGRISHYYLLRARARYMLENHGGARTDILTAMHLNPEQDNTISLTSRLFPGKSIEEIMASKPSQAVKNTLHHILASPADRKLSPVGKSLKLKAGNPEQEAKSSYRACIKEEELNGILVRDKQLVHEQVKVVLRERQSLKHKGPVVASRLPTRGALTHAVGDKPLPTATGWRNFSQGISVRDGSS